MPKICEGMEMEGLNLFLFISQAVCLIRHVRHVEMDVHKHIQTLYQTFVSLLPDDTM